jgi:RimJ/RimL family protein N-acetyltransferase
LTHASDLTLRPVAEADVRDFATWRYEPPYDGYNMTQAADEAVAYFLGGDVVCHVIEAGPELVAFFTFGSDARVPGGDYSKPCLDIGLGVRPSLTGQGLGRGFVDTVVRFAQQQHPSTTLRVTIASANHRAIKVWQHAGFEETQEFDTAEEMMGSTRFTIFEKPA